MLCIFWDSIYILAFSSLFLFLSHDINHKILLTIVVMVIETFMFRLSWFFITRKAQQKTKLLAWGIVKTKFVASCYLPWWFQQATTKERKFHHNTVFQSCTGSFKLLLQLMFWPWLSTIWIFFMHFFICSLKCNMCKGKALGWGHSQNKGPRMTSHFGNLPPP